MHAAPAERHAVGAPARTRRLTGCKSLLHADNLPLQRVVLMREGMHPLLQLAAVLLPQCDLRSSNPQITTAAQHGHVSL
jgi:hypothetical protein